MSIREEVSDLDLVNKDGMRASDRDRELAVALLCEAYAVGRLGLGEIQDRAAAAYGARTWGDLRRLTHDISSPQASLPRTSIMTACRPKRSRSPILLVVLVSLAMGAATVMPIMGAPLASVALIVLSVSALFAAGIAATLPISPAASAEHKAGDGNLHRGTIDHPPALSAIDPEVAVSMKRYKF